jgi:hypothetical protein
MIKQIICCGEKPYSFRGLFRLRRIVTSIVKTGGGEGGIRTLGTLLGYGALAKRCFRPLSHLTKFGRENMTSNQRLPIW